MKCIIMALTILAMRPFTLAAQTVPPVAVTAVDGIDFTDIDDLSFNVDGTPVIAYYEVRFFPTSTSCGQPIAPVNLGKPAEDVNGVILAKPLLAFGSLTPNCLYTLLVAAVGPAGEGVSTMSDPFVRVVSRIPVGPSKPTVVP